MVGVRNEHGLDNSQKWEVLKLNFCGRVGETHVVLQIVRESFSKNGRWSSGNPDDIMILAWWEWEGRKNIG